MKVFIKSCSIDSRNKQSPTCEVMHETKESSLQQSTTDSSLAQSVQHSTDDLEVVSSIPSRGNFLFCSSPSMLAGFWQDLAENKGIIEKLEHIFLTSMV